jgi:tripartite-type tricarboxylate transporter receptor subunit TctC
MRLQGEIAKFLARPSTRERLAFEGAIASGSTPEQYAAYIRSELHRWSKVVANAGIKPE